MPLIAPPRKKQLQQLLVILGIEDLPNPDWLLLDEALIHCSNSSSRNYERLEFFGDAVLRMAASDYLLNCHQNWSVGDMTSVRNVILSDRYLGKIARHYHLDQYLIVGEPLKDHLDRGPKSRLADSVESLIGAIYTMTQSLQWIRPWLEPFWEKDAIAVYSDPTRQNHKAALQEWTQHHFKALPTYTVTDHTPATDPSARFEAQVWFRERQLGIGKGPNRKAAEQAAAQEALASLPVPEILAKSSVQPR